MRRFGRAARILIGAAVVHALILGGFVLANAISQLMEEEPPVEEALPTEVTMVEQEPEVDAPPPEPEIDPLPPEDAIAEAVAETESAQPIGISADSTVEGSGGPAFQVGTSLAGPSVGGSVAQEILAKENRSAEATVMTQEAVDTPARPLGSNRPPAPPTAAARKRVSGFVVLQLLIDESGAVQETKILQSEPAGFFDDAVLDVAPSWRFTPATYKGKPVNLRVEQTIRFNLG